MKTEQIIKTLQEHNDWRRGKGKWSKISSHELGLTIDAAIERLQYNEKKCHLIITRKNQFIRRLESVNEECKQQVDKLKQELGEAVERLHKLEQERDEAKYIANYWRNPTKISDLKMET